MENTPHISYFAQTDFRGKRKTFGIKSEDRARHVYVIGKTGMGKSTLLENLAVQDLKNGEGMAFIDPHGKSADLLLDYVPAERIKDVVYFAPFDLANPISFNIMEDVGPDLRHLVADGLMATFKKIWQDAWSARMEYILNNTILALLEYPDATLLGVNRMLSDKAYRKKVVDNITDPSVRSFWVDEFANYTDRFAAEATPAIQNKIGQFTNNPLIRNIIGQPKSSFDLRKIMDEKKILIVNLSKGLVGEQNTELLGGMLVTKIYLAAMSRANVNETQLRELPSFYLHVDEFQSFANESFADILSEARKYKLSLTIAHQYIEQMPEEVRSAVFGNVGTIITFRVGPFDAEVLETVFSPTFMQEDLVNLGFAQIYLTLMIDGVGSRPFSAKTLPPIVNLEDSRREEIVKSSQATYGHPRAEVEKRIFSWHAEGRPENNKGGENKSSSGGQDRKKEQGRGDNRDKRQDRPAGDNREKKPETTREPFKEEIVEKKPEPPQKVVSLRDLAPSRKTPQAPKKAHSADKSALKEALQDLLGGGNKEEEKPTPERKKEPLEKTKPKEVEKVEAKEHHEPKKSEPESNLKSIKNEVPEDVLKKILASDDEN